MAITAGTAAINTSFEDIIIVEDLEKRWSYCRRLIRKLLGNLTAWSDLILAQKTWREPADIFRAMLETTSMFRHVDMTELLYASGS